MGTETSSRNSEVIHGGLYYPADSLKTRLCIRGRDLLYGFCRTRGVGHAKVGKWIVAQTDVQRERLEAVAEHCRGLGVPVRWVGERERAEREPDVRAEKGCLESPETGIVDSHGLMMALWGLVDEDPGRAGEVVLNTEVVSVEAADGGRRGWTLRVRDTSAGNVGGDEETTTITAETVVNAAGLASALVHNMAVDATTSDHQTRETRHATMYYAKGNYFSYSAALPKPKRLIYPAPEPGHGGLGTHLTLDLSGRVRFGPDVEWVESPDDMTASASRLHEAVEEIRKYLPGIRVDALAPDYAGIRPKLARTGAVASGKGFLDFVVKRLEGAEGWIDCMGIESPGLTSSLAIAEMVEELLYR